MLKNQIIIIIFLLFITQANIAQTIEQIPTIFVQKPHLSLTAGPQNTISQQDIATSGVTTLAQALQNLGGVQLQDLTGNSNQVLLSLRGFGANASSNTLLLINGIPIVNPDLAPPDLNAMPLNQIQSIAITAGSESILYGDQAVGGVIDIETSVKQDQAYLFSCTGGSYDQVTCSFTTNQHYQAWQYNVIVNRNQTNNYREHNDYLQNLLSLSALYPYATGKFQFYGNIANETMQFPGALTIAQVREDRQQASNVSDDFADQNGFANVHWQQTFSGHWQLKLDAAHRQMSGDGFLSVPFTQNRMVDFIKPQWIGSWQQAILSSGLELEQDRYQLDSSFGDTNNHQQKYSLYSLLHWTFNPHWQLAFGARGAMQEDQLTSFDDENSLNRAFATTLGFNFTPNANTTFYIRRAGSYRFPKADENATAPVGVNGLRTQRGESYETGVETQTGSWRWKANIYQLNLRDEIAFDPTQTPQQPFGSNRNLPPTIRDGMSLSANEQLTNKLQLSSQLNLVDAKFQSGINTGDRIPLVSEIIAHAGASYALSDVWEMYGEALFTGNQFTANDDANVGVKIGGYTVYNVNLRYTRKAFTAALHLNNIFNKYYYFYTVYQPGDPNEFYYPAPERNISLNLSYAL